MKEKKKWWKRLLKFVAVELLAVVVAVVAFFGFLSVTEYKPKDVEELTLSGKAENVLSKGDTIKFMTWNIGYGALGDNADFFMDGGSMVYSADKERVTSNMNGIIKAINDVSPDILLMQETDINSARSYHINEMELVQNELDGYVSSFANNFKVVFLPYPIPPIGKVDSGIVTYSSYPVESAQRIQLPIPFSWPVSMANLKRCLLVNRIPVEGTDNEIVLINLHLEAYDDGEGKIMQTKMLHDILEQEVKAGNYVIAGGDFNQVFSNADTSAYPAQEGKWKAGEIDVSVFSDGWQFLMDTRVPSCRSLDSVYAGAEHNGFQYYAIDGFIVSGNIRVDSLQTIDLDFVCSDHNPVVMSATLQ
ncbi:MAG: endonuclease [Lachnospiraceae bacterium]|nr:endonuclease [Lachnospiraceae bacterium]